MATLTLRDIPSHDAMVDHILGVWERSSNGERTYGAVWYADARAHAALIADIARIPLDAAAGIIAVLSPQIAWDINLSEAYECATAWADGRLPDDNTFVAFKANVHKAWAILTDPASVDDIVRGPKVRAFWRAILGVHGGPVIDRHATRVATGYGYDAVSVAAYARVQDAYVSAAAILGIGVHTVQATVWLTCKRELASTRGQLTFDWGWPDRPSSFGG